MIRIIGILTIIVLLFAVTSYGQEEDSTFIEPPADTVYVPTDSADTLILSDTLTEAQRALLQFEQRRQEYEEEKVERKPNLSFFDSLTTYFASERLNQRVDIEQSHLRDAGDYFHFDPSFFVIDYVRTPMRKTVQPFGLSGDRLNVINNGMPIRPFEHWIEPDGLMDLNDIPIEGDYDRYLIPGPAGMLFGGDRAVASLITEPKRPEPGRAESAILVDQGGFEYNYVRGKYSRVFSGGREIDMTIGYRNADGEDAFSDDDVYHYTGRVSQPLGMDYGLNASGQLYSRGGHFFVGTSTDTTYFVQNFDRDRSDRSAELSIEKYNTEHDAVSRLGYRYLRQGSHIGESYSGRFDFFGWGLFASREWISGASIMKLEVNTNHLRYHDGYNDFQRDEPEIRGSLARLISGVRYALTAGGSYVDGFDFLPFAAAVVTVDRPGLYALFSAGYTERAPSLHELHLRFQRDSVYSGTTRDYADRGNGNLQKEKQLVASGLVEFGAIGTNLRLSVTGGRIKDGIDWQNSVISEPGDASYRLFEPANADIDFLDLSIQQKLTLNDYLRLRSGGAYHIIEYDLDSDKPYSPDYQLFAGLELHLFWPQKLMHLFAYGEINYTSEYDGYDVEGMGNEVVANIKLSFRIKDFRFHYVQQNALSILYEPREALLNGGRFSHFGLVWNFFN